MEQKSNKKRNLLIILLLIIVIIIGFFIYKFCDNKNYKDTLNKENKRILVESSYSNYAWTAQFSGTVIFNDGTIYSWNSNNKKENGNYNINSTDGLKSYVLENGKKRLKRVTSKDIEKIENYINNLEDTIDIEYPGADQGTSRISVWNSDDQKITLSLKGDSVGENKSEIAQELLKLIDRYL